MCFHLHYSKNTGGFRAFSRKNGDLIKNDACFGASGRDRAALIGLEMDDIDNSGERTPGMSTGGVGSDAIVEDQCDAGD